MANMFAFWSKYEALDGVEMSRWIRSDFAGSLGGVLEAMLKKLVVTQLQVGISAYMGVPKVWMRIVNLQGLCLSHHIALRCRSYHVNHSCLAELALTTRRGCYTRSLDHEGSTNTRFHKYHGLHVGHVVLTR